MQVLAAVLDLPDMLKLICCSLGFAADLPDFSGESDSDDDEDDQDEQKVERFNAVTNAERTIGLLYCAAVGVSNSLEHVKQKRQRREQQRGNTGRHKRGQPKRRQRVDDDGSKQQAKAECEAHIEDEAILDEIDLVCQGIHSRLKELLEIGKPHHPQREQDDDEQQREEQDGFLKRMLDRIAMGHAFGRLQMNSCFLQGAIAAMEGFD